MTCARIQERQEIPTKGKKKRQTIPTYTSFTYCAHIYMQVYVHIYELRQIHKSEHFQMCPWIILVRLGL